jgi:hypothetical protein
MTESSAFLTSSEDFKRRMYNLRHALSLLSKYILLALDLYALHDYGGLELNMSGW